ncbi:MAG: LysR family transcriptional regulator [Ruminococcus sp.]|nr:LysR family transcriptional regulator [Ruminococcus sp.]
MTLQQLRYVIAVADNGSISEGAKQLFISQPSLSNSIKELERELGITIFNRTGRGITLSAEGSEFLSYARQVAEQAELLEDRYSSRKKGRQLCAVSTQHYAFAVEAFIKMLGEIDDDSYEYTLRETRTAEIIEDVRSLRSEVGVIYINDFNKKVIMKLLKENGLSFHPLFEAMPHVFISASHPLANEKSVTLQMLDPYPFVCFEQGRNNSFYFSEEICSTHIFPKQIHVSDRATLFNLLGGLNGYTISSGVLGEDINRGSIISVPLETDERMLIGWIENDKCGLTQAAGKYIETLKEVLLEVRS